MREQGCWHTFLLGPQGLEVNCIDFHATMSKGMETCLSRFVRVILVQVAMY